MYNLPIALREWFVKRLSEQFEKESKQIELLGKIETHTQEN